ncbi:protein CUSTOS-like isoform X2 [Acipenser ruthenus]|uniref:protein CUSTOS-like isoform X2 n=1 Tax=Acipenser ruthenus TaxID=7906 RepID=UPI002741B35D|nr:protein CUSTOS-like isoform X2 [Acipenser ruthenus]
MILWPAMGVLCVLDYIPQKALRFRLVPGKSRMAAPSTAASESDSSSEEDVQKLREAAWSFGTKETQKQTQAGENTKQVRNGFTSARPSRRPRVDDHEHDANELQTTPEFRAHVARKLGAMLDSITVTEEAASPPPDPGSDDNGFRLFSTSIPGGTAEPDPPPAARRRPPPSSSDSDSEMEERLREAAVSGRDILKHSAIPSQQNQGAQEEGRKGVREEGGSCSEQSATPQVLKKKKKKKKKKKESRLEEGADCTPETGRKTKAKRDT